MNCQHPSLRVGDTFDQLRKVEPCLFCQRDEARSQLFEIRRLVAEMANDTGSGLTAKDILQIVFDLAKDTRQESANET